MFTVKEFLNEVCFIDHTLNKFLLLQVRVRETYKNAHFLHCCAHRLNLVMKRGTGITTSSRIFFSNLTGIAAFFSRSPQRLGFLQKHMSVRIPCPSSTRWNFNVRTVIVVHNNLEALKACFDEIRSSAEVSDESISAATGFHLYLNDMSFLFWLTLFNAIMPHVEILYQQMQARNLSAVRVKECITHFKDSISEIRNSSLCQSSSAPLSAQSKEVCDFICMDVQERFKFTGHVEAAKLFNKEKFSLYKSELPLDIIKKVVNDYPFFSGEQLANELAIFYSRTEMHDFHNLEELLNFFSINNLQDTFPEITTLIDLLLTVPMTTAEGERSFSTMNRVKSFKRTTMSDERLNALVSLSVGSSMIEGNAQFKERVMEKFINGKDRRLEFTYK